MKRNWIIFGAGRFGFTCQRCGEYEKLPPNIPLKVMIAWAKDFEARHGKCKANG